MPESLKMSVTLPVPPEKIYAAWLNSKEHAAFTGGGVAVITPKVNGKFKVWDGYISGVTLELEPFRRIVQAWRTTDFPEASANSRLEILLEPTAKGTKLTLLHTNIPDNQAEEYRQGWKDYYFEPMKDYFKAQ